MKPESITPRLSAQDQLKLPHQFTEDVKMWQAFGVQSDEAKEVLRFLRGPACNTDKELNEITDAMNKQPRLTVMQTLREFRHRPFLKLGIQGLTMMIPGAKDGKQSCPQDVAIMTCPVVLWGESSSTYSHKKSQCYVGHVSLLKDLLYL